MTATLILHSPPMGYSSKLGGQRYGYTASQWWGKYRQGHGRYLLAKNWLQSYLFSKMKLYLLEIFIGIDQLTNTIFFEYADETFSSRSYRCFPRTRAVIDFIFSPIEKDHCHQSYISEQKRLQEPPELRWATLTHHLPSLLYARYVVCLNSTTTTNVKNAVS